MTTLRNFDCLTCIMKSMYSSSNKIVFFINNDDITSCQSCLTNNNCSTCFNDIDKFFYFIYCGKCKYNRFTNSCLSCSYKTIDIMNNKCNRCNKQLQYKSYLSLLPIDILSIIFYLI